MAGDLAAEAGFMALPDFTVAGDLAAVTGFAAGLPAGATTRSAGFFCAWGFFAAGFFAVAGLRADFVGLRADRAAAFAGFDFLPALCAGRFALPAFFAADFFFAAMCGAPGQLAPGN